MTIPSRETATHANTLTPQQAINRLEAWADYHRDAARRRPDDATAQAHRNSRDNYTDVANALKPLLSTS